MKPAAFEYHSPTNLEEAVGLLADLGDEAKAIAGGQSLVPMLALRLAVFGHLVDLRRVEGLRGIEQRGSELWIGAGTTQATVLRSAEASVVPLLGQAIPHIGHFQIRNRGTVGGSIAHADSAAELPAVAVTLDATIETYSPRGRREVPATEFLTGLWTVDLEEDELLTGVRFPVWDGRSGFAVEEFARRRGDFAIAGTTLGVELDGDGLITRSAIGLFGLGPTAVRAGAAEAALLGIHADDVDVEQVGAAAVADLDEVPSDLHGPAEYRTQVGATVVVRALRRALQEALHG